jgi:phosphoribosylpyrophosphate synthetase
MSYTLKLFSGTANPVLSENGKLQYYTNKIVAKHLGIQVSTMTVNKFVDGEVGTYFSTHL